MKFVIDTTFLGLLLFLDKPSLEFILQFAPKLIKIPSTISEHKEFISHTLTLFTGDIVISTGMTEQGYLDFLLSNSKNVSKLYLMHANSSYPTPLYDINIGIIDLFREYSKDHKNLVPAYSSHDYGSFGSIMAVAAGAKMIEKHVKIGSTEWAHFDAVALDLESGEFKKFVQDIRNAEVAYGDKTKKINLSEFHKYLKL